MTSNKENEIILSIELEERKLALFERQVKLRKEKAEAEAIELQNQQLKISLVLTIFIFIPTQNMLYKWQI